MSRIIVKNLPKTISEDRVRNLFGTIGLITDVQLKYKLDGRFRQFCFIGYQTEDEAKSAIKHFNNTHINTSKVIVELCNTLGDQTKPRDWRKHISDSLVPALAFENESIQDKIHSKKNESRNLLEKYKDEPLFEEFLEVHNKIEAQELKKIKSKQHADYIVDPNSVEDEVNSVKNITEKRVISDLEYLKQLKSKPEKVQRNLVLFTLRLRNLPYNTKKRDIKQFFKPMSPFTIRIRRNLKGIAYAAFKQEKQLDKALLKDKSFLNGKQISVMKYNNTQGQCEGNAAFVDIKRTKWKEQEDSLKDEEEIGESGKIFMRNLSYLSTEEDVEKLFSTFGPVTQIQLPIDMETKKSKGYGTLTFLMPEDAVRAYCSLDGAVLHGRMLHLLPAKSYETAENASLRGRFKDCKHDSLRANAANSHNWNALFVGPDAIATLVADRHGVNKADIVLTNANTSAAVRLALAETQVVTETRQYLMGAGVDLTAFTQPGAKRSKTIILAKNLPAHTEACELKNVFEKFGVIGRIILPPGGISALIEYLEPSEARKAFTCLAYTKFKDMPLYLEWAPENSLKNKTDLSKRIHSLEKNTEGILSLEIHDTIEKKEVAIEEIEDDDDDDDDDEDEEGTTLFVKNLNFDTTDYNLTQHFSKCGKLKYANVAKKHQYQGSKSIIVSMGYGFIRFCTKRGADNALKILQHSHLNGNSLEIKRSERTLLKKEQTITDTNRQQLNKTKQTGTKILIRNIPFQANLKEVAQLFIVFGELKAFRLPKKMSNGESSPGQHRGFGFVDYVTKSDAKKAFDALGKSTHLYGRRLILEWAVKDIDDAVVNSHKERKCVKKLRKRTAIHFTRPLEAGAPKKSKKSILDIV